jgi:hippurate hydrolase
MNGGGRVMCEEGIMDRFAIREVYALHNAPDMALGKFRIRPGPIMAATDDFHITITGVGGHAGYPHAAVDPLPALFQLGLALQTIPSRRINPLASLVVSVTMAHAGDATNVIPETAVLSGTVRSHDETLRQEVAEEIKTIAEATAASHRCTAQIAYEWGYPVTVNDPDAAVFAAEVAAEIVGPDNVTPDCQSEMGAEDFAYMLQERPGAYILMGAGIGPMCHHPAFNYNDEASPIGASWFARLAERALPLDRQP